MLQEVIAPSGGNGSFVYQWQKRIGSGSWTTISGANQSNYQPTRLSVTTEFRRGASSCGTSFVYTNVHQATVDDLPVINTLLDLEIFDTSDPVDFNQFYGLTGTWEIDGVAGQVLNASNYLAGDYIELIYEY